MSTKSKLVCEVYEALVHTWQVDADVEDDQPHLAALGETAHVCQLERDVVHAVEKAGYDYLTAEELPLREHLIHEHAGVCGLQHRDGRYDFGKPPVPAEYLGPAQRGQIEQIADRHAHDITPVTAQVYQNVPRTANVTPASW